MGRQAELAVRYEALRRKVGGNREKNEYEFTFGAGCEEEMNITRPPEPVIRILAELNYALQLCARAEKRWADAISQALTVLEDGMKADLTLTAKTCAAAEKKLLPLKSEAKKYELIYISHAHIDMNWMWGWPETVAATLSTFRTILHMMEEYPDFTFMQSQASCYRIVEKYDPAMMAEIQKRIAEGRWEVTANAWVETDKNMPDTESLLHHISVTRKYLRDVWKLDTDRIQVDFSPDTFGHSRFIPEIDSFAGVRYYYHCRGLQDEHVLYRYRAPSGAELLMYREPFWYNGGADPDNGPALPQLCDKCAGLKTGVIVYGVGDHGGGPTRRDIERIIAMREWPIYPAVRFGTLHELFRLAEKKVYDKLPVVDHELNTIFPGCYTTQSRIKQANRKAETALNVAQTMCALSPVASEYPFVRFEDAWRDVLFTHFHDILTGSCVQESREYALGRLAESLAVSQTVAGNAMRLLTENIDTSAFITDEDISDSRSEGAGVGVGVDYGVGYMGSELRAYAGVPNPERGAGKTRVYVVFNPSAEDRDAVVEAIVWDYSGNMSRLEVVDLDGKPLPFEIAEDMPKKYWDHRFIKLWFRARVPALGYTTVAVREKPIEEYPQYVLSDVRVHMPMGKAVLDNGILRAVFDNETGLLESLTDIKSGNELLSAPCGPALVSTEHRTSNAWNIGRYLGVENVTKLTNFRQLGTGTVHQGIQMEAKTMCSVIRTTVWLDAGATELRYELEVDWNEAANAQDTVPVLTFRVPLTSGTDKVLCDVPAGFAEREAAAIDIPCLSFACSEADRLVLASDCKYGFRLDGGVLSVTLINTAGNPDPYPERGKHRIDLWLGLGSGGRAAVKHHVASLNRSLTAMPCRAKKGALRPEDRLMKFGASSCVLSAIEKAETGELSVRGYETEGKRDTVTVELPYVPRSVRLTDFMGIDTGAKAERRGRKIRFEAGPYSLFQLMIGK